MDSTKSQEFLGLNTAGKDLLNQLLSVTLTSNVITCHLIAGVSGTLSSGRGPAESAADVRP